jgi:hypothetical protein
MEMKLKSQFIYGENRLYPNCEKSTALFELLKPAKSNLVPTDLINLKKMGYEVEVTGGTRGLAAELKKRDISASFNLVGGQIETIDC